jgi:hypothetical protein
MRPKEHPMFNGYTESEEAVLERLEAIKQGKTKRQLILELRDAVLELEAVTEFAMTIVQESVA